MTAWPPLGSRSEVFGVPSSESSESSSDKTTATAASGGTDAGFDTVPLIKNKQQDRFDSGFKLEGV